MTDQDKQARLANLTPAHTATARKILARGRRDLGEDLGGWSAVDLLLDNMAELDVEDARALLSLLSGSVTVEKVGPAPAWTVRMKVQVAPGDDWLAEDVQVTANNQANAIRAAYAKVADDLPAAVGFIAAFEAEEQEEQDYFGEHIAEARAEAGMGAISLGYDLEGGHVHEAMNEAERRIRERTSPRLTWGERRALGVEYDGLLEFDGRMTEEQADRTEEIEKILAANPLDGYTSEEIDAYNVEHFGNASGRPSFQEGA